MILAGVDLAWHGDKNPTAISYGVLQGNAITVSRIEPAIYGIGEVLSDLSSTKGLRGIAIDAPLIIENNSGQRPCETGIGKAYGSRNASCHTSNTKLYPNANSVQMSETLLELGFGHLSGDKWQIECYPHPAIIEVFGLQQRLKYKKGKVAEKKAGQMVLASLLKQLDKSNSLRLILDGDFQALFDEKYIKSLAGQALKSNEDALDSILCLYIAGLFAIDFNGEVFGDTATGYIWVPQGSCM